MLFLNTLNNAFENLNVLFKLWMLFNILFSQFNSLFEVINSLLILFHVELNFSFSFQKLDVKGAFLSSDSSQTFLIKIYVLIDFLSVIKHCNDLSQSEDVLKIHHINNWWCIGFKMSAH